MFEKFIATFIGKKIVQKLDLQEGNAMETKSWYKSKTVWAALLGAILGAVQPVSTALGHPVTIPAWVFEVLTGLGLYGLRTADKPLG